MNHFTNKAIEDWLEENSSKSQLACASIIPVRPDLGSFTKVFDIEIPEAIYKEEFDAVVKAYLSVLKKLEEYHKTSKNKSIMRYKHKDGQINISVIKHPKCISNGGNHRWDTLIIRSDDNEKILEDKPYNFSVEIVDNFGTICSKFFILNVFSYEKEGDNIVIVFGDYFRHY